jgi:cell division protein FtsI (penicillin-binding protein 3)
MGMLGRTGVELPEAGLPIVQSATAWKEVVTLTVAFGHGISVSPLHVMRGTAAIANGGMLVRPTLMAQEPGVFPQDATRIMQQATSDMMRKLMRLVVSDGFGKLAEVPGYYPGGKTGTAEKKVAGARGYSKSGVNITAFTSVFPMHNPRYAVYMMLDEPKANASTQGYRTAGRIVAPVAGKVIERVGPMLGLMPEITNAAQINALLAVPMQPARPPGALRTPPIYVAPKPEKPEKTPGGKPGRNGGSPPVATAPQAPGTPPPRQGAPLPAATQPPQRAPAQPAVRDLRHEAAAQPALMPARLEGTPLAAR